MSHETKAGLVVSCAFLCMVGAVVYLRMNDGGAPAATEAGELPPWPKQQTSPSPTEQGGKNSSAKADSHPGSVAPVAEPPRFEKPPDLQLTGGSTPGPTSVAGNPPAAGPFGGGQMSGSPVLTHEPAIDTKANDSKANDTKVASGPPVGDLKVGSEPKLDSEPKLGAEPKLPGGPAMADAKGSGALNIDPPAPPVVDAKTAAEPKIGNDTKTASNPGASEPPIGSPFAHNTEPASPAARMENPPGPTPPAPEPSGPGFTPGGGTVSTVSDPKPPSNPLGGMHDPSPPLEPKPNDAKPNEPNSPTERTPAGVAGGAPLIMPPPDGAKPPESEAPKPPSGLAPEPHTPPPASVGGTAGPGTTGPGTGGVNLGAPEVHAVPPPSGNTLPGATTPDPRFAPPPTGGNTASIPEHSAAPAAIAGTGTPANPPVAPVPLAAPPTVASPPIPVSGPPAGAPAAAVVRPPVFVDPRVESFDEETYVCKPSDTFQSICKDKYMTDKYANALLTFNRAHPLAADGIRNEPPVLKAGQPVYIPPMEILEKRYASLIPDLAPRAASEARPAVPAMSAPTLVPAPVPVAGAAMPPSGGQSYTVRERPETFYEIAQKQFGRAERWGAIWELNRSEFPNPNQPLPLGTVVRLPSQ